jgi:hypothetical protein
MEALRMSKRTTCVWLLLAAVQILVSCATQNAPETSALSDPTESLPARFKTQDPVPKPDFTAAAASPEFQQAIQDAAALLGSQPQPMRSEPEGEEVPGGVSFDVPRKKVEAALRRAHTDFLAKGFYLFRYVQNFDLRGEPDKIGLLPTTDPFAVMATMSTNGDNFNIGTAGVIAWMKELSEEQPYILTGIGFDYMEGYLTTPVKDADGLAKRVYQFCPDIVDQGVESVSKLALELEKNTLYFWWD